MSLSTAVTIVSEIGSDALHDLAVLGVDLFTY
jgi:hypothetical protein